MITPNFMIDLVSKLFEVRPEDLTGRRRDTPTCDARFAAMDISCAIWGLTTEQCAGLWARERTLVLHARKRVRDLLSTDPLFRRRYNALAAAVAAVKRAERPGKTSVAVLVANLDPRQAEILQQIISWFSDPAHQDNLNHFTRGHAAIHAGFDGQLRLVEPETPGQLARWCDPQPIEAPCEA